MSKSREKAIAGASLREHWATAAVLIACVLGAGACSKDENDASPNPTDMNAGGQQGGNPAPGAGGTPNATGQAGAGAAAGTSQAAPAGAGGTAATSGTGASGTGGTAGVAGGAGSTAGVGSGAGAGTTAAPTDAGQAGTAPDAMRDPVEVADYNEPGPYGPVVRLLNQGAGLVTGGSNALLPAGHNNDPNAFTLFYPEGGDAEQALPLLTFGNGTFTSPTFYDELINHVVSYGFIVIAPNTSNTGTAVEMLQGVDWVIEQNDDPDSPLYGRVDTEHIGAFGHSQGGAGTCRAGADPRIDAIAPLSGTSDIGQIQCPAFFMTTGGEAAMDADMRIETAFSQVSNPSMYGITVSGNHDEYTDIADEGISALIGLTSNDALQSRAAVTAWFDWQLKGMDAVGELFLNEPCGFCNDENLQRLDLTGF